MSARRALEVVAPFLIVLLVALVGSYDPRAGMLAGCAGVVVLAALP